MHQRIIWLSCTKPSWQCAAYCNVHLQQPGVCTGRIFLSQLTTCLASIGVCTPCQCHECSHSRAQQLIGGTPNACRHFCTTALSLHVNSPAVPVLPPCQSTPKHHHSTCSCVSTMPNRCTTCMGPAAAPHPMHFAPNSAAHCQLDPPPCSEHNFAENGSITKPTSTLASLCAVLQAPITYSLFRPFCAPQRPLEAFKGFLQNAIA